MAVRLSKALLKTGTYLQFRSYALVAQEIQEVTHTKTVQQKKLKKSDLYSARYGGRHTVTMLPGAGIGPELMKYIRDIFHSCGAPIDFEVIEIDPTSKGNADFDGAISSIRRNCVAIKGNIEIKSRSVSEGSRNVALRNELDLYVNVIHCKSFPSIQSRQSNIDIILVRQNLDCEYAMLEHESVPGIVKSLKIVTKENAERVARFAFEYARKHGRKKVTTVHKANIMKLSDGLFLDVAKRIHKDYPELQHDNMIIDNTCMQLVSKPHQFDVLSMPNLYGTIVANVICGLIGGPGLISGRNYSNQYAVFEPGTRNKGTEIAGKNVANPIAMIRASVDMLNHLGLQEHARAIEDATIKTVVECGIRTPDICGTNSSTDIIKNILQILSSKRISWPYKSRTS